MYDRLKVLELLERRADKLCAKVVYYQDRIKVLAHPDEIKGFQSILETVEEDLALALLHVQLATETYK